jgi:O-antigen/teichoic acid export membrane protein
VGALAGSEELGLYALAYKLGYMPNYLILGPFLLIWYPYVFSIRDALQQRRMIGRLAPYLMLLMSAAAFGVALFAPEIVAAASTRASYQRAWIAVPWISFGYWLWALFQILQTGFYVERKTRALPMITLSALVVNVFTNLMLVPTTGFVGAAVATVLTFAALCFVTALRVRTVYAVEFGWSKILAPAFAAAVVVAVCLGPGRSTPLAHPLVKVGLFAAWAAWAWFGGAVGPDDRAAVRQTIRARLGRRAPSEG